MKGCRLTQDQVNGRLNIRNIEMLSEFKTTNDRADFKCLKCNKLWIAKPAKIFRGGGCPHCWLKEIASRIRGRNEIINDHGEWLEINVSTKAHPDKAMLIDKCDYHHMLEAGCGKVYFSNHGYCRAKIDGKSMAVHRFLMKGEVEIDHANRNKTDNRRLNLRLAEKWQNMGNRGIMKRNKTGVTGVSFSRGKYRAAMRCIGRLVLDLYFDNFEDAVFARKSAEKIHLKEFAP